MSAAGYREHIVCREGIYALGLIGESRRAQREQPDDLDGRHAWEDIPERAQYPKLARREWLLWLRSHADSTETKTRLIYKVCAEDVRLSN
jgi:hypothetical protein